MNASVVLRFWSRVSKGEACWLWTGSPNSRGFGVMMIDGKKVRAHRLSWEIHNGPVPKGQRLGVLQTCKNKMCVRPDHLRLGDPSRLPGKAPRGPVATDPASQRGKSAALTDGGGR